MLVASVRFNGLSLPKIARNLLGPIAGTATTIATLFIIVATLAGVAIVVVNALKESAWGMFTIVATIPAALVTGFWMYKIRPGRVGEASIIGMTLVFLGVVFGKPFDDSALRTLLVFDEKQLSIILPVYAAIVSILPVWVLLCPRGYLSSYMKVGVIVLLAFGILAAHPLLKMPAWTPYHPRRRPRGLRQRLALRDDRDHVRRLVGFPCPDRLGHDAQDGQQGIGHPPRRLWRDAGRGPGFRHRIDCRLRPGAGRLLQDQHAAETRYAAMVTEAKPENQWMLRARAIRRFEGDAGIKEELEGRTAGAVTLALGMAKILASLPGMKSLMAYLYHFAHHVRGPLHPDLAGDGHPRRPLHRAKKYIGAIPAGDASDGHQTSWTLNIVTSVVVCFCWGYLLYTGNIDRLWRMMGIANQLLAVIGLAVGTTYLLLHAPKRVYALCTAIPFALVVASVFTAGILSIGMWWQEIGLLNATIGKPGLSARRPKVSACRSSRWS